MGRTWKKKLEKGKRGKPHNQRIKEAAGLSKAKLQRALRRELDIVQEKLNQREA